MGGVVRRQPESGEQFVPKVCGAAGFGNLDLADCLGLKVDEEPLRMSCTGARGLLQSIHRPFAEVADEPVYIRVLRGRRCLRQ